MAFVDPTTRLRIKNPIIESSLLGTHLKSRNVKKLALLKNLSSSKEEKIEIDTGGVLVFKSPQKRTARGDPYVIFKISDLETMQTTLTVMLFREAVNEHINTPIGSVLLLISSQLMANNQNSGQSGSNSGSQSVSVNETWQIVRLGEALDFGICRGKRKDGQPCTIPVNKEKGGYCQFHLQKTLNSSTSSSQRPPGLAGRLGDLMNARSSSSSFGKSRTGHQKNVGNNLPPGVSVGVFRSTSVGSTGIIPGLSTARFGGTSLTSNVNRNTNPGLSMSQFGGSSSLFSSTSLTTKSKDVKLNNHHGVDEAKIKLLNGRLHSSVSKHKPFSQRNISGNNLLTTSSASSPSSSSSSSSSNSSSSQMTHTLPSPSPGAKRPKRYSRDSGDITAVSSDVNSNPMLQNEPTDAEWDLLLESTEKEFAKKEKAMFDPLGALLDGNDDSSIDISDRTKKNIGGTLKRKLNLDSDCLFAHPHSRKSNPIHSNTEMSIPTIAKSKNKQKIYEDNTHHRDGTVIVPEQSKIFKQAEQKYLKFQQQQSIVPQHRNIVQSMNRQLHHPDDDDVGLGSIQDLNANYLPRREVSEKERMRDISDMLKSQKAAAKLLQESKQKAKPSLNDQLKRKQSKGKADELNKQVLGGCKLAAVMMSSYFPTSTTTTSSSLRNLLNPAISASLPSYPTHPTLPQKSSTGSNNPVHKNVLNSNHSTGSGGGRVSGLNSELIALMNVKSKHADKVLEEDKIDCDNTLAWLEAKDTAENELEKITEQKCTAYHCSECQKTTSFHVGLCQKLKHRVKTLPATKRFYECSQCHKRSNVVTAKGRTARRPAPCYCGPGGSGGGVWLPCGASQKSSSKQSSVARSNGLLLSMSENTSYQEKLSEARDAVTT